MSRLDQYVHSNRRKLRAGAWFCVVLLAYLSLIPGDLQVRTGLSGLLEHLVAYLGTAMLFALGYPQPGFPKWVRGRVAHEPDFDLHFKGVVGISGAGDGRDSG